MPDPSRSEFGNFLRSRRAKLNPKSVGLPDGRRRRAPGLRREEVAELAGIGVDWYIRLEQGRAVSPSVTTIDALARALRLSKVEHAHLRALASGTNRRAFTREIVPAALRTLSSPSINRLTSRADGGMSLPGTRLPPTFLPSIACGGRSQHSHLRIALSGSAPAVWIKLGRGGQAYRRPVPCDTRSLGRRSGIRRLLTRLRSGSPEFAEWWEAHDIRGGAGGIKRLRHPKKGLLRFAHASFQANDDPDLKLIIYSPA